MNNNKFTNKEQKFFAQWKQIKTDYKTIYSWVISSIVIFLFIIPLAIWTAYWIGDSGHVWIHTSLTVGDALGFYSAIISSIATIFLGAVAVYQTNRANKIAEKSMLIDEKESKPILTIEQYSRNNHTLPYISKGKKDYSINFIIVNKSCTPAFNVKTIELWISNVELRTDTKIIEDKKRFELPKDKIYWGKGNYDFQGCIFSNQQHFFSTGINFSEYPIEALERDYGGRYFISVKFTFENILGQKFKETNTILVARLDNNSEMIFDNRIQIEKIG